MSRGAPDYGNVLAPGELTRLDDMAELPPRLGFPSSIDRMGKVVLLETFETGGGAVAPVYADLGETCGLSSEYSRYGGYTYELETVSSADSYAGAYIRVAAIGEDKIGTEVQFIVRDNYPVLDLQLFWHDGTYSYSWGLRWDTVNEDVYIGMNDADFIQIDGTYKMFLHRGLVHTMKLVGDIDDEEYVRAYINGKMLTLPTKSPVIASYTYTPDIATILYSRGRVGATPRIFVDTMILTRAEP